MYEDRNRVIRLLIVDDDEIDREMIRRTVQQGGLPCDTAEAASTEEALELLAGQPFDCLLLDYFVPPTNGLDLLQTLREQAQLPAVVMLTGMGDEDLAVKAMKMGVYDYIPKERIDSSGLCQAVLRAVEENEHARHHDQRQVELERLSFYDSLTGLANRNLFVDRLTETIKSARRQHSSFAVLMMDLDGFKHVNDSLGHHAGDELLATIGARLSQASRGSDTVARLGGDEFTLLLPNVTDIMGAATVAAKLVHTVTEPIRIDGHRVQVGASIGIAHYPEHGEDHHTLLKNADLAMYRAKREGCGYSIYNVPGPHGGQHDIQDDLPGLAQSENLVLYYQPKVNLASGDCVGAEVLIRWNHPELGLLPPQEFVPAAEKTAIIRDLNYRIIDLASAQFARWVRAGIQLPLAINLSDRMLSDHDLPDRVEEIRRHYGIRADQLTFEINESALISDPRRTGKTLETLSATGYRVAVDDFGTGYSSLGYLRDYPIDEIKIDRSFVQTAREDSRNRYIVEGILRLAKAFDAEVVAEGIEDRETWRFLDDLGCNSGQGFFFARPVAVKELERWLENWQLELNLRRREARSGS